MQHRNKRVGRGIKYRPRVGLNHQPFGQQPNALTDCATETTDCVEGIFSLLDLDVQSLQKKDECSNSIFLNSQYKSIAREGRSFIIKVSCNPSSIAAFPQFTLGQVVSSNRGLDRPFSTVSYFVHLISHSFVQVYHTLKFTDSCNLHSSILSPLYHKVMIPGLCFGFKNCMKLFIIQQRQAPVPSNVLKVAFSKYVLTELRHFYLIASAMSASHSSVSLSIVFPDSELVSSNNHYKPHNIKSSFNNYSI